MVNLLVGQFGYRHPITAITATMAKRTDQRVRLEQIAHNLAQGATPFAMNEAYFVQASQIGIVEVAVEPIGHLVGTPTPHIEGHRNIGYRR
jgi:hypothetical protein